ncbi:sulfotransferase [Roseiarcus fermentans]|uniref:Sulfotransferase n=1 Tax=Roseiarcus fermentans TaxID=1473586 RepID=A0A366FC57_9HYPH|nr:sulfotransferase [Roseiarcus fermentans]RBP12264.1 sulfotransferase [Roseiarcus fermentans]
MHNRLHFISGLPRSGSTLLSALLRQNPRFIAGMSSPVFSLFRAMLSETSNRNETAVFIDDETRKRLLTGVFDAYYHEAAPDTVIFDTNRGWTTKLPALVELFPDAKVVCCVRNPAWVLDSVESLVRRNAFELSGIFSYDSGGTVYSRIEGLASANGMYGYALNALREAVYGAQSDRLLLVRYESLVANPLATLAAIYSFTGEDLVPHDPKNIEPNYDMIEFDLRLGTPGLHDVGRKVSARERPTILPPDLFNRYKADAFWEDLSLIPPTVSVV